MTWILIIVVFIFISDFFESGRSARSTRRDYEFKNDSSSNNCNELKKISNDQVALSEASLAKVEKDDMKDNETNSEFIKFKEGNTQRIDGEINNNMISPVLQRGEGHNAENQYENAALEKLKIIPSPMRVSLGSLSNNYQGVATIKPWTIGASLNINKNLIRDFVVSRNIDCLVHFTRVENLPGILNNGLLGRVDAKRMGVGYLFNDHFRLDDIPNAISTSISFPNYKMFYGLQRNNEAADWAVIKLSPSLLWELDVAFCASNAAAKSVTSVKLEERRLVTSLSKLFSDRYEDKNRSDLNLPKNFPTNPQAEVLVLERILPDYIMEICFNSPSKVNDLLKVVGIIDECKCDDKVEFSDQFFRPRFDWAFWKK